MKKFLLSMLGVLIVLPGIARDFTYEYEGQTLTYTVLNEDAKTCWTKAGDSPNPGNNVSGALVIPAVVKDGDVEYTVTEIGGYAFYDCSGLTSVIIPNSVNSIGEWAFKGCSGLTSVTIPNSVTSIGEWAFKGCSGLTSVTIPNSVTSIGDSAFRGCSGLTSVTIGNSVTSIGESAFYGCSGLTSVEIPNSVTSIGVCAFSDCSGLTSVTIGNSVTSIGTSTFADCSGLTSVTIGNSVTSIDNSAFYRCSGLTSVEIPNSVTLIGNQAFKYCSSLTSVEIPNSVTEIGSEAFYRCSDLTSVEIPNSVTSIGFAPFDRCSGLKKSAYPSGLSNPFDYGKSIQYPREGAIIEEGFVYGPEKSAIYFAPLSLEGEYAIPNSVTSIGNEAFSGCTALTEVILPPSVETIGASAFAGNSKLTSIIMGHKVTSIGEKAFDLCPAQTVSITAQTPPAASDNTFSNYTGKLYVQGQEAADAYYNAGFCWNKFEAHVMIAPAEFKVEGNRTLSGKPGDTFQLTATLMPENVTLPHVFWRSTNPDIATVDANGLVTLHTDMSGIMTMAEEGDETSTRSCKIIAESLYANGPVAEFTVNYVTTGIDEINDGDTPSGEIDFNAPVKVYNLQGVMVSDSTKDLAPGIYIVRQGKNVRKIAVR